MGHPPGYSGFEMTELGKGGPPGQVMTRVPGQMDRLVMTIHEHGILAPTMNDDSGPMPQYAPDPYPDPQPYPNY